MNRLLFSLVVAVVAWSGSQAPAQVRKGDAALGQELQNVYLHWRDAMVRKDFAKWQGVTASHRQIAIQNRLHSERRPIPAALFALPAAPPDTRQLRMLDVKVNGVTAKAIFYGAVDFEVGVKPPNNLLVLSFVNERGSWRYDTADFVNLAALPDVREELEKGDLRHLNSPEFAPTGKVEQPLVRLPGPVKYIAKTYVYCPGREVQVQVNKVSRHLYQNTKDSEVIVGGARDGRNEVQYAIKALPGGQGTEPMTIRVYLMSQVQGVKPLKVFEYQVEEGGKVKDFGTGQFSVGPDELRHLRGG